MAHPALSIKLHTFPWLPLWDTSISLNSSGIIPHHSRDCSMCWIIVISLAYLYHAGKPQQSQSHPRNSCSNIITRMYNISWWFIFDNYLLCILWCVLFQYYSELKKRIECIPKTLTLLWRVKHATVDTKVCQLFDKKILAGNHVSENLVNVMKF